MLHRRRRGRASTALAYALWLLAAPAFGAAGDDDSDAAGSTPAAAEGEPVAGVEPTSAPESEPESAPEPEPESAPLIADELDLAERQIEAGEAAAARDWLTRHITVLSDGTHRYDAVLIRPVTLLGDAYMQLGQPAQALDQYQLATHLERVNSGLHSPEQVAIVYREAAAYKALGALEDANDREEYAFRIVTEDAQANDPALIPAIHRLADWYLETDNPYPARALYQQAVGIHAARSELESEVAVPSLRGLAATFRVERFPSDYQRREAPDAEPGFAPAMPTAMSAGGFPAGEQALQQVVRIRQPAAESEPQPYFEAILELADWYSLFEKPARANALYAHAFEVLGKIPNADAAAFFADPRMLYLPDPGQSRDRAVRGKGEVLEGHVEVGYAVTEGGFPRNLVTISSEPEGLMDMRVRRSLRASRFRPALVDGVPVATANRIYRHTFTYEEAPPEEAPPEEASDDRKTKTGTGRSTKRDDDSTDNQSGEDPPGDQDDQSDA